MLGYVCTRISFTYVIWGRHDECCAIEILNAKRYKKTPQIKPALISETIHVHAIHPSSLLYPPSFYSISIYKTRIPSSHRHRQLPSPSLQSLPLNLSKIPNKLPSFPLFCLERRILVHQINQIIIHAPTTCFLCIIPACFHAVDFANGASAREIRVVLESGPGGVRLGVCVGGWDGERGGFN